MGAGISVVRTEHGCSAIAGLGGDREGVVRRLAVNANLMHPHTAVPVLSCELGVGSHRLACAVFASPVDDLPDELPPWPSAAEALLERIGADELS